MGEDEYDPTLLAQLGQRRKRAMAQLKEIREPLRRQVVAAGRADVPQVEVANVTGIGRDEIRKIWRDAGIGPKP